MISVFVLCLHTGLFLIGNIITYCYWSHQEMPHLLWINEKMIPMCVQWPAQISGNNHFFKSSEIASNFFISSEIASNFFISSKIASNFQEHENLKPRNQKLLSDTKCKGFRNLSLPGNHQNLEGRTKRHFRSRVRKSQLFIGPESDHLLCLSLTHSLTDSLRNV